MQTQVKWAIAGMYGDFWIYSTISRVFERLPPPARRCMRKNQALKCRAVQCSKKFLIAFLGFGGKEFKEILVS